MSKIACNHAAYFFRCGRPAFELSEQMATLFGEKNFIFSLIIINVIVNKQFSQKSPHKNNDSASERFSSEDFSILSEYCTRINCCGNRCDSFIPRLP